MSGITEQVRKQANLRLLQRTCSREINDVVQTATHVVLYEFICDAWQKSNIEGSMFLTQTPTKYHLVILNRHSTENLKMDVTDSIQLQNQDPYLIFRERIGDATRIRGIWFHNADERIAMANALQQSIEVLRTGGLPPVPTHPAATATPSTAPRPPPLPQSPSSSQRASSSSSSTRKAAMASPSPEPSSTSSPAALTSLLASMVVSSTEPGSATGSPVPQSRASSASSPSSPSPSLNATGGVALDKKSLQLALLSLIQDDRFLDLLHSQYLRVVHARVKKQQQQNNGST